MDKESTYTGTGQAKLIKISREAAQEIITEFFMENQKDLFELNDQQCFPAEIAISFLDNGDVVCFLYDRSKGILDIDNQTLEAADYTSISLFSPEKAYRTVSVDQGAIMTGKASPEDGTPG